MAAVDNFLLIFRELRESMLRPQDLLMVGGGIYTLVQAVRVVRLLTDLAYVHGLSHLCRRRNIRTRFGQWAVVTGSTHGIGKAYARELASQGVNIIVLALDQEECIKVAKEIADDFKVFTMGVGVDFNDIESLYDDLEELLKDYDIGVLVNNAGVNYDAPNHFLEIPKKMTNMVLPHMLKRRRGAIVNISSGASLKPQPQLAVFTASETPFYVSTKMTSYKKKSLLIPSSQLYARSALKTLGWSSRTTGYWPHSVQLWLCDWISDRVWFWFTYHLNTSFRISILREKNKYYK